MLQSKLFPKTRKDAPKDAESVNHKLLVRAGFIDQLMAGSWTLMPLGWRVVDKINNIIREELTKIDALEVLMPLLHPKSIWNETGRWETAKEVMYQFKDSREKEFALSFTHEEIFLDLVRKHVNSYQDLPVSLYHFSTKFRNEPRARSGILRGREFMMKDLYSLHVDEKDFWKYYEEVKEAYSKIFKRIGFKFKITEAGGGVFTDNFTHEFQVPADGGEDLIYYCSGCDWAVNREVFDPNEVKKPINEKAKKVCPLCGSAVVETKSIEAGNIFPFGTYYSEKMNVVFTDEKGRKTHPHFGSYGIGSTRVMGTWVETDKGHDEKGIIWPESIAPYQVHLVELKNEKNKKQKNMAKEVYEKLSGAGIEVLWDDRDVGAGQKFADADLIGLPVRLVVSEKTGEKVEMKIRTSNETELRDLESLEQFLLSKRKSMSI
jgi:prolyl-tRNA synthetase